MPPKKKEEKINKPLLGRPTNNLKVGIVGLPNVGKSTTFNCLTKLNVPAENYPFCTIDPHQARVAVPDKRYQKLCEMWKPKSEVPAQLTIFDIAGLVPGASEGEGLGNAFLSHINGVDGIIQVIRIFEDKEIVHTEGTIDPIRDLNIIRNELLYKDIEFINKHIDELKKKVRSKNIKEVNDELVFMISVKEKMDEGKWVKDGFYNVREIDWLNERLFLTAKNVVYLINMSENAQINKKQKYFLDIKNWIDENGGGTIIPFSASQESKLLNNFEFSENKQPAPSYLTRIIKSSQSALDLIQFFTAGVDEVKCWTIRKNTKAPSAAGTIHTDFERGFICAEVMKYTDYVEYGSEYEVKSNGLLKQQGKAYIVEDGDIIFFRFNVTNKPKK